jgi:crotonobetainyl-CoA:carnitine CoA-transferase CaiB-like acyl-CoA transferase
MILADLGADVVLIERPNGGDPTRRFAGHFEALGRNKRSVALDLKDDRGKAVFLSLASAADVVVEGFRPGVMARLGLDAHNLRSRHPELIFVSISSFGHTGPLTARGGHDLTMQAAAGFLSGSKDERPAPAPLPLADIASAMYATIGIVTGLLVRARTGRGTEIDVSMLDALVSWHSTMLVSAMNGLDPAPYPPDDPGYGVFRAADGGLVTLSIAGEDHQWRALCEELGLPELAGLTELQREERAAEIDAELSRALGTLAGAEVVERCASRGIGAGLAVELPEVADDPQVVARGQIVHAGDDADAPRVVRQPLLFDGEGSEVRRRAPQLGEHTREILQEVGYSANEIDRLVGARVVAEHAESSRGVGFR